MTPYALRLELNAAPDVLLPKLGVDRLRFHLSGENTLVHPLYELLCSKLVRIVVRDLTPRSRMAPVTLPASSPPSGLRRRRGHVALPAPFLHRLSNPAGILRHAEQVPVPGPDAASRTCGRKGSKQTRRSSSFFPAGDEDRRERLETGVTSNVFRLGCFRLLICFRRRPSPFFSTRRNMSIRSCPISAA